MIIQTTKSQEELQAEARALMKRIAKSGKRDPRFAALKGISAYVGVVKKDALEARIKQHIARIKTVGKQFSERYSGSEYNDPEGINVLCGRTKQTRTIINKQVLEALSRKAVQDLLSSDGFGNPDLFDGYFVSHGRKRTKYTQSFEDCKYRLIQHTKNDEQIESVVIDLRNLMPSKKSVTR